MSCLYVKIKFLVVIWNLLICWQNVSCANYF